MLSFLVIWWAGAGTCGFVLHSCKFPVVGTAGNANCAPTSSGKSMCMCDESSLGEFTCKWPNNFVGSGARCVACNLQRSASRMAYHMHMYECLHKRSMRVLQTHTHTLEDRLCCSAWGGATFSTTRASHFCKKKGSLHKQTRKQETRLTCCFRKV